MPSNYPDDMPFWDKFFDRFEPVCPVCEGEIIKHESPPQASCITCDWCVDLVDPNTIAR